VFQRQTAEFRGKILVNRAGRCYFTTAGWEDNQSIYIYQDIWVQGLSEDLAL
jgi:hypothetical protein